LKKPSVLWIILIVIGLIACSTGDNQISGPVVTEGSLSLQTRTPRITNTPTLETTVRPVVTPTPLGLTTDVLQDVTIRLWHPWSGSKARTIELLVDQFNIENDYGINVEVASHGDDLYLDVRSGLGSQLAPEIVAAINYQIQSWDNYGNAIVDMNIYVSDPEWGLKESELSDFYPFMWEQDLFNGKRLGIPAYRSSTLILYNQSWARELGFADPPTTTAEFKEQACAAAASTPLENPGTGGWMASTDPATVMSWVLAFGGDGIDEKGDGYDFNTPDVEAAFGFIKSMFKSGCAWLPDLHNANEAFAARQGLFFSSSLAELPAQVKAFELLGSQDKWSVIPYPAKQDAPVINLYGSSYTILASTPAKQFAAWLFIKWVTQPENQAAFAEATSTLPTRISVPPLVENYARVNPRWAAAQDLISLSHAEPVFGSWVVARWTLSDAAIELVGSGFTSEEIPLLLKNLDTILAEIHIQNR